MPIDDIYLSFPEYRARKNICFIIAPILQSSAASDAADAQKEAANTASQTQLQMFNTTQANLKPYMTAGGAATNALLDLTGLTPYTNNGAATGTGAGVAASSAGAPSSAQILSQAAASPGADANTSVKAFAQALGYPGAFQNNFGATQAWLQQNFGTADPMQLAQIYDKKNAPPAAATASIPGAPTLTPGESALTSPLLKPIAMDQATLEATPGYKFNLSQGLKSTQSGAAARGLGTSGAALKGAAAYATGLADSTYQNQFSNAVTNQTNIFNRLLSLSGQGQNAAANLGSQGTQTASNIGNNLIGGANAGAAAGIYGANAVGGAGGNALLNAYAFKSAFPQTAASIFA